MTNEPWAPPPIADLLAPAGDVARSLGVKQDLATRLIRAGLVGRAFALDTAETKMAGEKEVLDQLAEREVLNPDDPDLPAAVLVRVSDPQPEEGTDRRWTGWHRSMPESVAEAATARWWPLGRQLHEESKGKLLIVSLGTVIVRVRRINEVVEAPGMARVKFETSEASGRDADVYRFKRLESRRGPVASPINFR